MTLPVLGPSGVVIGADISPAMLEAARGRLGDPSFSPVAADGQALPFKDAIFDAVTCQLGLQFFPDPALGLMEFRRVLRTGGCAAVCVNPTADRVPMWGILADVLSRYLPEQRDVFQLSFALADPERLGSLFAGALTSSARPARAPSTVSQTIGNQLRPASDPCHRHTSPFPKRTAVLCELR
jgi:SAM-dependent methyltransferase